LGTDALTARAVAEAGAEACSAEVCLGPAITVDIVAEHRHFAGTLWVSPESFRAYVGEVIESPAYQGWEKVIVINGHGGNVHALAELCGTLTRDERAYALPFTWFDAIEARSAMGHGGPLETALLRATHPELVREGQVEAAREGMTERWGEWISEVNLAVDSVEFTDSGVVGDPGTEDADGERGEVLLAEAGAALAPLLVAVAERDTARPARK
jgi:creatinine amidohydrolase